MNESGDDLWARVNEAEADAEAAEARALAAEARARAMRLRKLAAESGAGESATSEPDDTIDIDEAYEPEELDPGLETAEPEEIAAIPRRRRRLPRLPRLTWRRAVAAVAVLAIVGLTAASGYGLWKHYQRVQVRERAQQFSAAAADGVLRLTTLDFAKAQDDVNRVLEVATGSFKNDFQSRSEDFIKVVEQSKVVSKGVVQSTAVESMKDDSAVVLVAATSEIIGPPDANQKPRAWRLSVTVSRDGDKLKLSKVDFVQ